MGGVNQLLSCKRMIFCVFLSCKRMISKSGAHALASPKIRKNLRDPVYPTALESLMEARRERWRLHSPWRARCLERNVESCSRLTAALTPVRRVAAAKEAGLGGGVNHEVVVLEAGPTIAYANLNSRSRQEWSGFGSSPGREEICMRYHGGKDSVRDILMGGRMRKSTTRDGCLLSRCWRSISFARG
jgi:hypothetical protein